MKKLNELQSYLTRLRGLMLTLIILCSIGVGNVWGADVTYTYNGDATPTTTGTAPAGSTAALSGTYSKSDGWMQCANSGSAVLTLSGYKGYKITAITIHVKSEKKSGTGSFSVTAGSTTIASIANKAFNDAAWNSNWNTSGVYKALTMSNSSYEIQKDENVVFALNVPQKGGSLYIQSWAITYEAVAPETSVTASPASITFDRVTLDPENGAEGSKDVTISLTNGNVGYPGDVSCYLNGWVETDETDCEFYVNSGYSYQKTTSTTSETLSLSYSATDAGTFSGNFIIQGFNASHVAVNCTIPLSVIVDAPACNKTVTINKGTETNCSFTLSKSGAQASCAGVSTTVTVTPNTGYGTPNVTQSGASASPTITGSGTSWTVTYPENTTGTSVINVSCSAKTTTISFDQNGGTGGQTSTKTATYGQAMPTPITTPTRTGYTFEGYYDGSGGTGNKYYNADGSSAANWNKEAATATLYAKWTANTYTVSWSVNGSVTSTTPGVAYNTTTSTPANPSVPGECTGSTFMGWTATQNYTGDSAPGNMFNGTTPAITGDITFYAVFADEN